MLGLFNVVINGMFGQCSKMSHLISRRGPGRPRKNPYSYGGPMSAAPIVRRPGPGRPRKIKTDAGEKSGDIGRFMHNCFSCSKIQICAVILQI